MRPAIYGYMRVPAEAEDEVIRQLEVALRDFADANGYCFATIFHEYQTGAREAFDELVTELQRVEAHHVVVPSLNHLAMHPILRDHMLTHLACEAKAEVLELGSRYSDGSATQPG